MFRDFVMPNNNEDEFIELSQKLYIKKLYFLYYFDDYKHKIIESKKIDAEIGFIVSQKNINKAIKQSKMLIAKSSDQDRLLMESKKIKLIYGFEDAQRKDYLHQRASGLNHILCNIAQKNNVAVGFSYSSLLGGNEYAKSTVLGRMIQNIKLCRKYKVKTVIGSFSDNPFHLRAPHDVISLFATLGMDGKTIKEALTSEL